MKKISVIVPIYNVEQYLEKCIKSICRQSYSNLEIILVDDGSPDHCGEICESWKQEDDRIRVIHKENGGLSDARNAGIEIATGEYLVFIDSDDYIHPNMIEYLYQACEQNQAEIAVCEYKSVSDAYEPDLQKQQVVEHIVLDTPDKKLEYQYEKKIDVCTVAWNKIYRRRLFENVRYPKGKIHEDEFTTYKLFYTAQRIVYIPLELYYYVQRSNSIMGEGFQKKTLYRLDAYEEKLDFYQEHGEQESYRKVLRLYKIMLVLYYKQVQQSDMDIHLLDRYMKNCREKIWKVRWELGRNWKEQISYRLFCCMPGVYLKIQK